MYIDVFVAILNLGQYQSYNQLPINVWWIHCGFTKYIIQTLKKAIRFSRNGFSVCLFLKTIFKFFGKRKKNRFVKKLKSRKTDLEPNCFFNIFTKS